MMMMMAEVDHQRKKGKEPMHRGEGERVCVKEKTKTRKWYHSLLTLIISLIIIIRNYSKFLLHKLKISTYICTFNLFKKIYKCIYLIILK